MIRSEQRVLVLWLSCLFLAKLGLGQSEDIENWDELETCGDGRKCITYNLCPELSSRIGLVGLEEVTSNITVGERFGVDFGVRFGDDFGGCSDNLEVCCRQPSKVYSICSNDSARSRECGSRNENGLNDNTDKLIAGFAEFPWIVAVLEDAWILNGTHKFFRSTGSLINTKVVITSADETANIFSEKLVVRAGEWNLLSVTDMCEHEERGVAKVIRHSEHRKNSFQNNLALMILDQEFQLSPVINIVCLPPKAVAFDPQQCFLSGWDKECTSRTDRAVLNKVDSNIVPKDVCVEKLRNTMLGDRFELHENFLCADSEPGINTAKFSGGSPLMCSISSHPNNFFLAGVAVGGFTCAFKDIPETYADLTKHRDWIEEQLIANGIGYSFITA